tara:strand:- start:15931 stop:16995 length:1065 start_codon:yes stop_codon:yes gene_type:complete
MIFAVTGSSGLIGSEVVSFLSKLGHTVHGIDNNQRAVFFGSKADTSARLKQLKDSFPTFSHHSLDIRDREKVLSLIKELRPHGIIHAAAQPSHDKAASIPFEDFDINAVGTLNLLESARRYCPEAPFVHMSTNKVYGDSPNTIKLEELDTRWDYEDPLYANGISESFSIDQCKHSLFGASKVASDILVQEYGRYFDMPTCCLRCGCLTGPSHMGVELHGFLSYLIKCNLSQSTYKIFGYKGKQVRDNIDAEDVASFINEFLHAPRCGEVYNLGGGKKNSCSILEAFDICEDLSGYPQSYEYVENHRSGDHICYYSDLSKIKSHYPQWSIRYSLRNIFEKIVNAENARSVNSKKK